MAKLSGFNFLLLFMSKLWRKFLSIFFQGNFLHTILVCLKLTVSFALFPFCKTSKNSLRTKGSCELFLILELLSWKAVFVMMHQSCISSFFITSVKKINIHKKTRFFLIFLRRTFICQSLKRFKTRIFYFLFVYLIIVNSKNISSLGTARAVTIKMCWVDPIFGKLTLENHFRFLKTSKC